MGGAPTQPGTFTFTVQGVDQEGEPLQQAYSLTVSPPLPLSVSFPTTCCNAGTVGQSYLQNIFESGGVGPFTGSVASGQLPPGLRLTSSPSLSITGTPSTTGTFSLTVRVTDSIGDQATMPGTITIT